MKPVYLIAIVAAALLFVLVVDVRGSRSAQQSADKILNNSTRAIELVEDLRWQIHQLGHTDREGVPALITELDKDVREYAPLAIDTGEAAIWTKVHDSVAIAREAASRGDFDLVRSRTQTIGPDVDRLVEINNAEVASYLAKMSDDRIDEIIGDIVAVIVAAIVIAALARALYRSQAREKELARESLLRAEERNRELDAFAGRAAHDLRSPLNPIRGYAELISTDANVSPDTRRQASLITKGVLRMSKVIDDMLSLSRAGHPEPGNAQLGQTLEQVREELEAELRDVSVEVAVEDVAVACSENSLEQILRNLLGNASKYRSPERPLEITVVAGQAPGTVRLVVSDNGTGMDPESRAHAFDPFFRGRRDIAGTGLGLSIVEKICRSIGGTCTIEANEPEGTSVIVTLPR